MEAIEYSCSICGKTVATEKGLKIHVTRLHGMAAEGEAIDSSPFDFSDEEQRPVPVFEDEQPPVEAPKRNWREKVWGDTTPKAKTSSLERKPRKRRTPTDGIWSTAWTAGGLALQRSGADVPVGRVMQFQAPIVGSVLDEAIEGTFIDTLLQPIAGSGKKFKKLSAVLSLPVLVGIIERSPQTAPMLEPLLREVLREHLVALAAEAKKVRKQEEEYRKAMIDLGMEVGDDPIDALMGDIFGSMADPSQNGASVHAHA